jgi:hypothetical protein
VSEGVFDSSNLGMQVPTRNRNVINDLRLSPLLARALRRVGQRLDPPDQGEEDNEGLRQAC